MEPNPNTEAAEATEATAGHGADRPPTSEEERAAERAAGAVDVEEVGKHFQDMSDIGAHVKGEGAVE